MKIFLYRIVEEQEVSPVHVPELQYLPPGQKREVFPHQEVRPPVLLGEILVDAGDPDEREDDVRLESEGLQSEWGTRRQLSSDIKTELITATGQFIALSRDLRSRDIETY